MSHDESHTVSQSRIDRLLQPQPMMDVSKQQDELPLILLIPTGRATNK